MRFRELKKLKSGFTKIAQDLGIAGLSTPASSKNLPKGETVCPQCQQEFPSTSHLRRHIKKIHEQDKKFKCGECTDSFMDRRGLADHMRYHTGDWFQCDKSCGDDECEKIYSSKKAMIRHQQREKDKRAGVSYPCRFQNCGKKFTCKNDTQEHEKICKENPNRKTHKCHKCGKKFGVPKYLYVHERECTGK